MVLLAFVGGLMIGGTVGVLVAALCFAAWRSDASVEESARQLKEADAHARAAAAPPPLPPLPRDPLPVTARFAGRGSASTSGEYRATVRAAGGGGGGGGGGGDQRG